MKKPVYAFAAIGCCAALTATLGQNGYNPTVPGNPNRLGSASWFEYQMGALRRKSATGLTAADADRARAKDKADAKTAEQQQKEIKAENARYSAAMGRQQYLDRVTAEVPSPSLVSNTLRMIGPIEVNSQTNRRSGTIDYRVLCQSTNRDAIFSFLRQVPNRTSISQGTNSVTFAIRLPTTTE